MAHNLEELRKIFTSALASDCLDKLGYTHQVLDEDINMISGSGIMLGYAFPVRLEIVNDFPEVPYIGLLKALDAVGKDQVYVTPTNRTGLAALWGELLSTACAFKGVAGARRGVHLLRRHLREEGGRGRGGGRRRRREHGGGGGGSE